MISGGESMSIRRILALSIVLVGIVADRPRAGGQTVAPEIAVAPQYDSTHVYLAPQDVDSFAKSFLGTFGGTTSKQVVATVTPTPSSTTSQLMQTPVGTVSLFGYKTPTPVPFGTERNGYLVKDMDAAIQAARAAGAAVIVAPFPDAIGIDAVIQWPGGVNMQLYWHTKAPTYAAFQHIPENRVYVSPDRADAFTQSFVGFSHGKVVSDDLHAPGVEIGAPGENIRIIRIESLFGKMIVFVSKGFLPFPYGYDTTGYEVDNLDATLARGASLGVAVLVQPFSADHRRSAIVRFPGGFIAEVHQVTP
jgi:hypothetical protein